MYERMNRFFVVVLAIVIVGVFSTQSYANTLFYLYIPNGAEVLKADLHVFNVNTQYSCIGVVLGRASVRLVYRINGEMEKYTLPCFLPDQNPLIPLPIDVEMYYDNIKQPYLEYID